MKYPEVEFYRYFTSDSLSEEDRTNYPGRLDTSTLDDGLASVLREVQDHINQMFDRQVERINASIGPVKLHLDYIAAPKRPARIANAIAFGYSGFSFIGLTLDLVQTMFDICSLLSGSSTTAELLGIDLKTNEQRAVFLSCLFSFQLQFVVYHELGHHFHGHTPMYTSSVFFSEFERKDLIPGTNRLEDQAGEVEADGYAVHMILPGLCTKGTGQALLEKLRPEGIATNKFLVCFLLSSIGS